MNDQLSIAGDDSQVDVAALSIRVAELEALLGKPPQQASVGLDRDPIKGARLPKRMLLEHGQKIAEGDPAATDQKKILEVRGWTVSDSPRAANIAAVDALDYVYSLGRPVFIDTIETLTDSWGHVKGAVKGPMLRGCGMFLYRNGDLANRSLLTEVLHNYEAGPEGLLEKARKSAMSKKAGLAHAVASEIVTAYNAIRLPEWEVKP